MHLRKETSLSLNGKSYKRPKTDLKL